MYSKTLLPKVSALLLVGLCLLLPKAFFAQTSTTPKLKLSEKEKKTKQKFDYSLYPVKNSNDIRFAFENDSQKPVLFKVYDRQLKLLYSERITGEEKGKKNYDFSELEDGQKVTVKVMCGKYTKVHPIKLWGKDFEATILPKMQNPKRIMISYKHAKEPVEISVVDKLGNEYFNQVVSTQNYEDVLNLDPLQEGVYIVKLNNSGNVMEHQVYVNE